jgi:hypothetical protein
MGGECDLGRPDHRGIPPLPGTGLVAADEHHGAAVGVECEQHSGAAVDAKLLELGDP